MTSHILLIGYPKDGSAPRVTIVTGPAQPAFNAALATGKYLSVALAKAHEFQSQEAQA